MEEIKIRMLELLSIISNKGDYFDYEYHNAIAELEMEIEAL